MPSDTKDCHMEKNSGKGAQTGRVGQLGQSQGCGTRKGWLESKSYSLAWRELTNYNVFQPRKNEHTVVIFPSSQQSFTSLQHA